MITEDFDPLKGVLFHLVIPGKILYVFSLKLVEGNKMLKSTKYYFSFVFSSNASILSHS